MPSPSPNLGRALQAVDVDHRSVMPGWRRLLHAVIRGDERTSPSQRAQLLGVPGRRDVLRIGGAVVAGAAVLAACSDDDSTPTVDDEEDDEPEDEVTAGDAGEPVDDVVLVNTALSLEVLAVDTYQVLLESELVASEGIVDVAALFQSHHAEHRDALAALVDAAGEEPFLVANPVVKAGVVDPAIVGAGDEAALLTVVHDLEQAAAQTYVHAATALSTRELRATAIGIGGVEARHGAILRRLAELDSELPSTYPTDNPLPSDAIVTG